jgi:hypothetical protein
MGCCQKAATKDFWHIGQQIKVIWKDYKVGFLPSPEVYLKTTIIVLTLDYILVSDNHKHLPEKKPAN